MFWKVNICSLKYMFAWLCDCVNPWLYSKDLYITWQNIPQWVFIYGYIFQCDCSETLQSILGETAWANHLSAWCYSPPTSVRHYTSSSTTYNHSLHPAWACKCHNIWTSDCDSDFLSEHAVINKLPPHLTPLVYFWGMWPVKILPARSSWLWSKRRPSLLLPVHDYRGTRQNGLTFNSTGTMKTTSMDSDHIQTGTLCVTRVHFPDNLLDCLQHRRTEQKNLFMLPISFIVFWVRGLHLPMRL